MNTIWTAAEARSEAAKMDAWYSRTGFDGYRYERDKWNELANKIEQENEHDCCNVC